MKTIAVYNNKGGCAKTVTTVNVAYCLAAGHKVLVVDMDPQGNASAFFKAYDLNKRSITDVLTSAVKPIAGIRRTKFRGLDIVPANYRMRELTPSALAAGRETLKLAVWVYSQKYDYCIIDCAPGVDSLIETIMDAVDEVMIPIKPDRFSADGLETVKEIVREFAHEDTAMTGLFTQFYKTKDSLNMVHEIMASNADMEFFQNVIRRCSAVDHSLAVKKPLARCASKSPAAQDYTDLVTEYLEREENAHGIA